MDIAGRPRGMWIIDFGVAMTRKEAALYQAAFEHVAQQVQPQRSTSRTTISAWWLHEPRE